MHELPVHTSVDEIAAMQTEHRKRGLKQAADYLRATAKDYDQIAERYQIEINREVPSTFRDVKKRSMAVVTEKAQLLRGQADQIQLLD